MINTVNNDAVYQECKGQLHWIYIKKKKCIFTPLAFVVSKNKIQINDVKILSGMKLDLAAWPFSVNTARDIFLKRFSAQTECNSIVLFNKANT